VYKSKIIIDRSKIQSGVQPENTPTSIPNSHAKHLQNSKTPCTVNTCIPCISTPPQNLILQTPDKSDQEMTLVSVNKVKEGREEGSIVRDNRDTELDYVKGMQSGEIDVKGLVGG
jgi:hypothetical protein